MRICGWSSGSPGIRPASGSRLLSSSRLYLDLPDKFIDLEVLVSHGDFHLKFGWSKPTDSSTLINGSNLCLQNIGKRLNLLYPESHELRVVITTDQFMIHLRMDLYRAIN